MTKYAAQREWSAATDKSPYSPGAGAAHGQAALDDAIARVAELQYAQAATALEGLVERFRAGGDGPRCAEAMFWLGYCHEKQARPHEARELYSRAAQSYTGTPGAAMAQRRLTMMDQ